MDASTRYSEGLFGVSSGRLCLGRVQNIQTETCLQRPNQFPLTSSKRSFKFRWRLRRRTADSCSSCSLPRPCRCLLTLPAKGKKQFHKITALLKISCQSTRGHSRPADRMHPGDTLLAREIPTHSRKMHIRHTQLRDILYNEGPRLLQMSREGATVRHGWKPRHSKSSLRGIRGQKKGTLGKAGETQVESGPASSPAQTLRVLGRVLVP